MGLRRRVRDSFARLLDERLDVKLDGLSRDLRALEIRMRRDVKFASEAQAVASTARLVEERMAGAADYWHPTETLRASIAAAPTGGMALEFGVFQGATLREIAAARTGLIAGFDSFQGLPEVWRAGFRDGAFATEMPDVPGVLLVPGWFDETVQTFLDEHDGRVDFAHVDCDLYSSTVTVLTAIGPRLEVGSVVQFDEYFNYPGWERGEFLAWEEFTARAGIGWEYLAYTGDSEQVSVRVTSVP